MNRIYTTLFSLLITASFARAQQATPQKLSLQDCIDYAMKHNYSVKNAQLDVLIQQAQNAQTTSAALPHVNGKIDFTNFNIPQTSFADASTFREGLPKGVYVAPLQFTLPYAASAGFTASQTLFDGSVIVALKARNSVLELARLNENATQHTVKYNVFKAYNSLVVAYKQFNLLKSSLVFARSMEHDGVVAQQNGFTEKIDVDRARVAVNNLESDSIRIENILTLSEQVLKFQIGMDLATSIVLTDTLLETRRDAALELLNTTGKYESVPEFKLVNMALKLSEYNVERYKMAALPSVGAFWSYGTNYGGFKASSMFDFDKYVPNSTLGLSLNMPIFNGLARKNQVTEAKLNVQKSQNNIENMKLVIDFQQTQSRTSLKNSYLQVQSQKRNIDLSNDVLDLAQKKYKSGVGSNFEVTQAQSDQIRAQNNYFTALMDLITAEADLKKALGLFN